MVFFGPSVHVLGAQTTSQESLSQQIQKLTDSMARTQAQLEESQRQLDEMRKQLTALQRQLAQSGSTPATTTSPVPAPASSSSTTRPSPAATTTAIEDLRERQAMLESQIATHEQTKVESESKYPVKVTGLLLLNGFVNTGAVDMAATPTVALPGSGSTGATVRQTVLGLDARGPHLFGARSYANLRVDFDGSPQSNSTNYSGYYNSNTTLLRLRTAYAALQWKHTEAYFSLDRPIFSPDTPTSLTAVAVPPLAWSGNLWTWNPQVGVTQDLGFASSRDVRLQAALIDVGDAPLSPVISASGTTTGTPPSTAEQSRWPGVEARVALLGSMLNHDGSRVGLGGYFAPHHTTLGHNFDAWAGTLDWRLLLPARLQLTGSFYRGMALGGLGGGAYKDFAYRFDPDSGDYYLRSLDDVGGWAQLKEKLTERVELNAAFGLDDVFAGELRPYAVSGGTMYQNLARNRTYTGNVIYSPSAYLQFSLEYRHLESSPVVGPSAGSNIISLGAGYKF
ncbi:MAG TPA: hypothetical protein VMU57_18660 [Edaphobacter sp.]|uniref:hypothetical protein n=1 Tax=Edaphobacter sp. TaxID=1934404 RepID=UPI002BB02058|nr:hypothetical protein [Edaphobacter sp.]HUZ96932.1 hypothetical protein [Edaphobacter sp.]